jgi:uncharacterized protein DUF5317
MLILLFPALLAGAAAALRSGSFAGIRRLRIEWWPLAVGALALKVVIHDPPFNRQPWALEWGPLIWVFCMVAILAMLVRNAVRPGIARIGWQLTSLGIALNLLVVVSNGGYMPQSEAARMALKGAPLPADANVTYLYNVIPMGAGSRLGWLGDNFAEPDWVPMANVISVGDLTLSLGVAALAFLTLRRRPSHVGGPLADS